MATEPAEAPVDTSGEDVGKVRGPDVDSSFHVYEFTDPATGEPLETHQVVHDVAVGVNADGSLKTAPATDTYAKPADAKAAPKASTKDK